MARNQKVMGVHAPPPRITRRAVWLAAFWIGGPFLVFCFALDLYFAFL